MNLSSVHDNGDPVLEVRDVTVRFGGLTALDSASLAVPPRHVAGVIGPNGAGKTTLLNVLCGFIRPDHGEVRIGGSLQRTIKPHRLAELGVARTLQGVGLFGGLTALENVMVGATSQATAGFWSSLLSLPRVRQDERKLAELAREALEKVGAATVADARPGELSYGMRKRIALARALAGRPRLLLLDEPASGLDETELAELGQLIRDLAADSGSAGSLGPGGSIPPAPPGRDGPPHPPGGISVVVVEHHMDLMMSVCDTITVLDFGKVIAAGTPRQIQADPAVTAAYLGTAGAESAESTTEPAHE